MRTIFSGVLALCLLSMGCHSIWCGKAATSFPPPALNLPVFGSSSANTICVAITGAAGAVRRPGIYYLPQGAIVRDAVDAAQGVDESVKWRRLSGIEKKMPDGTYRSFGFKKDRSKVEFDELHDGDCLYFGR